MPLRVVFRRAVEDGDVAVNLCAPHFAAGSGAGISPLFDRSSDAESALVAGWIRLRRLNGSPMQPRCRGERS